MEAFKTIIWIINIFSSLAIIGLVLMQHGKGADAGAGFSGSGSAQGVFGSAGNANFLSRMTALSATIFFASCLALGYINTNSHHKSNLDFSDVKQTSQTKSSSSLSGDVDDHHTASTPMVEKDKTMASEAASSAHSFSNNAQKAAVATTAAGAVVKKLASDDIVKDKAAKNEKSQSKENKSTLKDKKTLDKKKHEKLVKKPLKK